MFSSNIIIPTADCAKPHIAVVQTSDALARLSLHVNGHIVYSVRNIPAGQHQIPTSALSKALSPYGQVAIYTESKTPAAVSVQMTELPASYNDSRGGEMMCPQYNVINTDVLKREQVDGQQATVCGLLLDHDMYRIDVKCTGMTSCRAGMRLLVTQPTVTTLAKDALPQRHSAGTPSGTHEYTFATVAEGGVATFFFPDPVNFSRMETATLTLFGNVSGECSITGFSKNYVGPNGLRFMH